MKIYVAGKYSERDKISEVYDELRKLGHEITVDWTNTDIYPNDVENQKLGLYAQHDIWGVQQCDVLIACLLNDHSYKGLWVEMGVALGLGKTVYLVGNAGDSSIFVNHPLVSKYASFDDVYKVLGQPS